MKNQMVKEAQDSIKSIMIDVCADLRGSMAPLLTKQEKHEAYMKKPQSQIIAEAKIDPEKAIKEAIKHMPRG